MLSGNENWRPTASLKILEFRAGVLARIRAFMAQRAVLEVETPVLNTAGNPDPNILSLTAEVQLPVGSMPRRFYLHTSPEFAMKRLLAAGSGPIYQITKVFRDNEAGRIHQPEFTMLEWYRPGFNHLELMNEIEELLRDLGLPAAGRMAYADLFEQYCQLDPHGCPSSDLQEKAAELGMHTITEDRPVLLDLLFSHAVTPNLGKEGPVFVYDYPACQAALAKLKTGAVPLAERFELFINSMEIANGYNELDDTIEVYNRFKSENEMRRQRGLDEVKIDRQLLGALEHGMPPCAGVALGLDRLLLVLTDRQQLEQVMTFPVVIDGEQV